MIFAFEGEDVEQRVRAVINDSSPLGVVRGSSPAVPRSPHEVYYWEADD